MSRKRWPDSLDLQDHLNTSLLQGRKSSIDLNKKIRKLKSVKAYLRSEKDRVKHELNDYVNKMVENLLDFKSEMLQELENVVKNKEEELSMMRSGLEEEIDTLHTLCEETEKLLQFDCDISTYMDRHKAETLEKAFRYIENTRMSLSRDDQPELEDVMSLKFEPAVDVSRLNAKAFGTLHPSVGGNESQEIIQDTNSNDVLKNLNCTKHVACNIKNDIQSCMDTQSICQFNNISDKQNADSIKPWSCELDKNMNIKGSVRTDVNCNFVTSSNTSNCIMHTSSSINYKSGIHPAEGSACLDKMKITEGTTEHTNSVPFNQLPVQNMTMPQIAPLNQVPYRNIPLPQGAPFNQFPFQNFSLPQRASLNPLPSQNYPLSPSVQTSQYPVPYMLLPDGTYLNPMSLRNSAPVHQLPYQYISAEETLPMNQVKNQTLPFPLSMSIPSNQYRPLIQNIPLNQFSGLNNTVMQDADQFSQPKEVLLSRNDSTKVKQSVRTKTPPPPGIFCKNQEKENERRNENLQVSNNANEIDSHEICKSQAIATKGEHSQLVTDSIIIEKEQKAIECVETKIEICHSNKDKKSETNITALNISKGKINTDMKEVNTSESTENKSPERNNDIPQENEQDACVKEKLERSLNDLEDSSDEEVGESTSIVKDHDIENAVSEEKPCQNTKVGESPTKHTGCSICPKRLDSDIERNESSVDIENQKEMLKSYDRDDKLTTVESDYHRNEKEQIGTCEKLLSKDTVVETYDLKPLRRPMALPRIPLFTKQTVKIDVKGTLMESSTHSKEQCHLDAGVNPAITKTQDNLVDEKGDTKVIDSPNTFSSNNLSSEKNQIPQDNFITTKEKIADISDYGKRPALSSNEPNTISVKQDTLLKKERNPKVLDNRTATEKNIDALICQTSWCKKYIQKTLSPSRNRKCKRETVDKPNQSLPNSELKESRLTSITSDEDPGCSEVSNLPQCQVKSETETDTLKANEKTFSHRLHSSKVESHGIVSTSVSESSSCCATESWDLELELENSRLCDTTNSSAKSEDTYQSLGISESDLDKSFKSDAMSDLNDLSKPGVDSETNPQRNREDSDSHEKNKSFCDRAIDIGLPKCDKHINSFLKTESKEELIQQNKKLTIEDELWDTEIEIENNLAQEKKIFHDTINETESWDLDSEDKTFCEWTSYDTEGSLELQNKETGTTVKECHFKNENKGENKGELCKRGNQSYESTIHKGESWDIELANKDEIKSEERIPCDPNSSQKSEFGKGIERASVDSNNNADESCNKKLKTEVNLGCKTEKASSFKIDKCETWDIEETDNNNSLLPRAFGNNTIIAKKQTTKDVSTAEKEQQSDEKERDQAPCLLDILENYRKNKDAGIQAKLVTTVGSKGSGTSPGLFFPIGVTTNSRGDIIVTDTGNHLVKMYDRKGVIIKCIGQQCTPPMRRPSAAVVNENDCIFVKDDICIRKFDKTGWPLQDIGYKQFSRPFGLALTSSGRLVVLDTNYRSPCLIHMSQDGSNVKKYPYAPLHGASSGSKCRFMAISGESVIVSDLGLSNVYITDLEGNFQRVIGRYGRGPNEFYEPSGVTVDQMGHILVGDSKNNKVKVWNCDGTFIGSIEFSDQIVRPSGIHLTADKKLLISNYLFHQIKVYQL